MITPPDKPTNGTSKSLPAWVLMTLIIIVLVAFVFIQLFFGLTLDATSLLLVSFLIGIVGALIVYTLGGSAEGTTIITLGPISMELKTAGAIAVFVFVPVLFVVLSGQIINPLVIEQSKVQILDEFDSGEAYALDGETWQILPVTQSEVDGVRSRTLEFIPNDIDAVAAVEIAGSQLRIDDESTVTTRFALVYGQYHCESDSAVTRCLNSVSGAPKDYLNLNLAARYDKGGLRFTFASNFKPLSCYAKLFDDDLTSFERTFEVPVNASAATFDLPLNEFASNGTSISPSVLESVSIIRLVCISNEINPGIQTRIDSIAIYSGE